MAFSAIAGFALVAFLITIVPGPDVAFTLRWAIREGRGHAFAGVFGIACGCLLWAFAGAFGLVALLNASRTAYEVLRYAGAAYLLYLGARTLWRARRGLGETGQPEDDGTPAASRWTAFGSGLLNNVLNPKIGAFYLAVLPQFIGNAASPLLAALLLALVHAIVSTGWLSAISWAADRARRILREPVVRKRMEQITGIALVAFGIRVATESG